MSKDYSLEMDAIAAHLDRGWDLLHQGDLAAARVSAARILKLNEESPEGLTLLGAIVAAGGDAEEGLEYVQQAMELDPEYLDAVLYAAELAIHSLGDLEQGLRLCDEAAELVVEAEDRLDLGLMRAEAHLLAGHAEQAARDLDAVEGLPCRDPAHALRSGRINLDVGRTERAVGLLTGVLGSEVYDADAHYFLAVAVEQLGRHAEALQHFLEASRLDRQQPSPWELDERELKQVVRDARDRLPPDLREPLAPLPVHVLDHPATELIAEGFDPRGLVFVSGISGASRPSRDDDATLPTAVFVYRANLVRAAGRAEVAATVEQALRQEAGLLMASGS